MLWVTGIRGALSVALAAAVPYYDEVLDVGAKYSRELNYMTHAVVVFGCIIQACTVRLGVGEPC
jgi:NhaP-type Na+/H+ or K+/H+ antiporter